MPTNIQLIAQIQSLDPSYKIDGLNNAQLGSAFKGCKIKQTELIDKIKELSPDVKVEGLDLAGLQTILESVDTEENRKALADKPPAAPPKAPAKPKSKAGRVADEKKAAAVKKETVEKAVAKKAEKFPYSIKAGKSVTSKKGVLAPGDEVKAEYLGGGQKSLDALVKSGHVDKK